VIKKVLLLALGVMNFSSCATFFAKTVKVDLDNEYQEIILRNTKNEGYVYSLYLSVSGKIYDEIKIELNDGDIFTRKEVLTKGRSKYVYDTDWYTDVVILKIYSKNNNNGKLKIRYYFSDFKPLFFGLLNN